MIRFPLFALLAMGLAWVLPPPSAADPQVDSKAWAKVSTTGPPVPVNAEAQRAKLTMLDEIVRGVRPYPGLVGAAPHAPLPAASRVTPATVRPLSGAELAAAEARMRAKRAATAPPAPRWLGLVGPLPPKPREVSTSVPLTGEALARSLEQERAKLAAPPLVPRATGPPSGVRWDPPSAAPSEPREAAPAPPLNPEQRAKLDAARAAHPSQDNH